MGKQCDISGKKGQTGNRVSHANNKTKHVFKANLQPKKIFVSELGKHVRLRVSTRIIRTIDKIGLAETLRKHKLTIKDLM